MPRFLLRFLSVAAVALLAVLPLSSARAAAFDVDGSHTSVVFNISHLGFSYTYGMFRKTGGEFEFDRANPAASRFSFVIDAASLDTLDPKRDEHLRSADFFNVKQFPQITFVSTSVAKAPAADSGAKGAAPAGAEVYNVTGTLTMHGVSQQVTLPMRYLGEGTGPFGKYRVGFLCQTKFKRSNFGMNFMAGALGDEVGVSISFEGLRK